MRNRKISVLISARTENEQGSSLIELVFYILLLASITAIAVSIITHEVSESNITQGKLSTINQLNTASTLIQRNITQANGIQRASTSRISLVTVEDGQQYQVDYFAYVRGVYEDVPEDVRNNDVLLQNPNSIFEYRVNVVTGESNLSVIVSSFSSDEYNTLFEFYDKNNYQLIGIDSPILSGSQQAQIKRIKFNLVAIVDTTGDVQQVESSAVPMLIPISLP